MKKFISRNLDWIVLVLAWIGLLMVKILLVYVGVFIGFVLIMFLIKKDLKTALFYGLLLALPFERGIRGFDIEVVPPGPEIFIRGFKTYFGITPKLVAAVALFLVMLSEKWRIKKKSLLISWCLVLFLGLGLLSSFKASQPNLALVGWWRLLLAGWLAVISQHFFRLKKHRKFFLKYLVTLLLFLGLVGSLQFITKQPLGLFLEDQLQMVPFGRLTNESRLVYRVSGLVGHPTFFASFLTMLFPMAVLGLIWGKNKLVFATAMLLGFISIFASFSRSAWLTVIVIGILISVRWWRKQGKLRTNLAVKAVIANIIGFLILFGGLLQLRLRSFNYIWSLGSGRGRLLLMKKALTMIKQFPILGVGLNHFTRVVRDTSSDPEILALLFPVHNTFLLFLSELGILAGFIFIIFMASLLVKSYKQAFKTWRDTAVLLGVVSYVVNAQFHTLFGSDPSFELMMVMAGYLMSL